MSALPVYYSHHDFCSRFWNSWNYPLRSVTPLGGLPSPPLRCEQGRNAIGLSFAALLDPMDNSGNRPADSYSDYPDELPVIVRRSEVLNLMVMDRGTMQEVGRVERLWMYPQAHRVLGVICKGGGLLGKKRWAYKLPQIESLNQGNIWIEGPGNETSPEQIRQLQTLIDHEIWVDGGDRLGVIVDCLFNRKTGQITQYLFVNNRLRQLIDASNPLRPEEILSFGNNRVLVSPQAVARLRRERPNLRETFSQMKEQARSEYEQVTSQTQERVRNWGEEAKTAKERLAEQAAVLKQQAAERAKALQEQAAQEILPQITEQAQELSQKVGEQYHTVQRRAQDFVEELPPLEQLGEEMRGYGRDRDPNGRREQDYAPRYNDGYGGAYGSLQRDRYDETWDQGRNPEGTSANDGDFRQSRRSRYRRDERLGEYPSNRAPESEINRYDNRPYGDGQNHGPQDQHWDANEPNETTWVDEPADFDPVRPSQTGPDDSASYQTEPRRERYRNESSEDSGGSSQREHHEASRSEPAPAPTPKSPPIYSDPPASRDNPWGYADNATESDWDDLGLAQEEPTTTTTENESTQPEQAPLPVVAPEDLDDDDPWI